MSYIPSIFNLPSKKCRLKIYLLLLLVGIKISEKFGKILEKPVFPKLSENMKNVTYQRFKWECVREYCSEDKSSVILNIIIGIIIIVILL